MACDVVAEPTGATAPYGFVADKRTPEQRASVEAAQQTVAATLEAKRRAERDDGDCHEILEGLAKLYPSQTWRILDDGFSEESYLRQVRASVTVYNRKVILSRASPKAHVPVRERGRAPRSRRSRPRARARTPARQDDPDLDDAAGIGLLWADVDRLLDVRKRIGYAVEELDFEETDRARFYLLGLLEDLENTCTLVPAGSSS